MTKQLLGWENDSTPRSFLIEGRLIRKQAELAEAQLKCYENKLNKLRNKMWIKQTDPLELLKTALERWNKSENFEEFEFRKITLLETSQLVSKLGNSTTYGHDEIDALTIKLILPYILIPLQHIVNSSLVSNKFAMKWKLHKVIPLLKSTDSNKLDPEEYRPVSLLSTTAKIVERAAQIQLLDFFEKTEQLNNNAHAYRPNLSTTTTIMQICEALYESAELCNIASILTVDQSAAFDTLNHEILLNKMKLYKVGPNALLWLRDYLTNRSQYVSIGTATSRWRTLEYGVPQGSVLGPLL